MMNTIKTQLLENGYSMEEQTIFKNGLERNGYVIRREDSTVGMTIYELPETFEELMKLLESQDLDEIHSVSKHMLEKDFITTHITYKLLPLDRVEGKYPYRPSILNGVAKTLVIHDEEYSIPITTDNAKTFARIVGDEVTEDGLFALADFNLAFEEIKVKSLLQVMAEMMNVKVDELESMVGSDVSMYMVSNKSGNLGARAIEHKKVKEQLKELGLTRVWVIPSSIHEVLVIDADDGTESQIASMIREVNSETVAPEEQLSDVPTLLEL